MKSIGKIGILGDSYSTFGGCVPATYPVYYDIDAGERYGFVNHVDKTWWTQVIKALDGTLVKNSSYSGSCVCNYDCHANDDCTPASFITRVQNDLGADKDLDTILVYGLTNDLWRKNERGQLQYDGYTTGDLNKVYPALCATLGFLKSTHPAARIVFITNPFFDKDLVDAVATATRHFGIEHCHLTEFERVEGHPTEKGMKTIANQVIAFLGK